MSSKKKNDTQIKADYAKAAQNLTDILVDDQKFKTMCSNVYDAIDTDNLGTLPTV